MALTRAQTVALALTKLGVSESPPRSNNVEFSRWWGFTGPWCAMYASWILDRAGNTSGFRFASTAAAVAWARRARRLIPTSQARPGDVVIHLYSSTTGHAGMATESPRDGQLVTVEGNTAGGADRDGGSVMLRRRSLPWWQYCIRIDYPEASARQEVTPMFGPFDIRATVASAKDPATGGVWLLGQDGSIFAFEGARGVRGVNGQSFFAGRQAARFNRDGNGFAVAPPGKILTIIASSGETYDLPF